jgi:prepilin-type N-terminal cleavage/methylation domain-containing protein
MAPNFKTPGLQNPLRGFSLIEVLVATVVFGLILAVVLTLLGQSQDGFTRLSGSASRRQNAQTALQTMAGELKAARVPTRGQYELANPADRSLQLLINPAALDSNPETRHAHSMFWQTTDDALSSGSALVGYFVRWETEANGTPRPRLCRLELDNRRAQIVRQAAQQPTAAGEWPTVSLIDTEAPGDANNGFAGWMADDILALFVRPLDMGMNPITNEARAVSGPRTTTEPGVIFASSLEGVLLDGRYDSRKGYQFLSGTRLINCPGPRLPAAVEIAVVSAPARALRLLTAVPTVPAATNPVQFWTDIEAYVASLPERVRKDVRTYSVLVPLSQP